MATKVIGCGPPVDGEAGTISVTDAVQSLLACSDLAALKTLLGIAALETSVADHETRISTLEEPA